MGTYFSQTLNVSVLVGKQRKRSDFVTILELNTNNIHNNIIIILKEL